MEITQFGIFSIIVTVLVPYATLVEAILSTSAKYHQQYSKVKISKPKWDGVQMEGETKTNHFNGRNFKPHHQHRRPQRHSSSSSSSTSQQTSRTFAIPTGTELKLTPEITIPISNSETDGLECKTQVGVSFPISIKFKKVDWRNMGEELFGWDPISRTSTFWTASPFDYQDNHVVTDNNGQLNSHRRMSRDLSFLQFINQTTATSATTTVPKVKNGRCPIKSLTDRKSILEEVEIAGLRMFGLGSNPKDCLLRAICEMHEEPIFYELGLLGEAVTVTFSFEDFAKECEDEKEHSKLLNYLKPFISAEMAGKSGTCQVYHKKCPKSIFTYV